MSQSEKSNLQRAREYYYANRERILQLGREKVVCQCGCRISRSSLICHLQTVKHKNYMHLTKKKVLENDSMIIMKRHKKTKPCNME